MSNRLTTIDRVPLTPDVEVAGNMSETFLSTRRQAETVVAYGRALVDTVRAVGHAFSWLGERVDEAEAMCELASLNDRMLADIGLKRSDIPLLCQRQREDDVMTNGRRVAA
jgi:uncharacterized protein YjiS (DUF1127 family)